jgi:hypothetical protein
MPAATVQLIGVRCDEVEREAAGATWCSRRTFFLWIGVTAASSWVGCRNKVLKRPPGYLKLGKAGEFTARETNLPDLRFLVRFDAGGLSAMSTACTYDLSPLQRRREGDSYLFVSSYTESRYDDQGRVLHGPAVADLPYYRLVLDSGVYGGPRDTVYADLATETSPQWRLRVDSATARTGGSSRPDRPERLDP